MFSESGYWRVSIPSKAGVLCLVMSYHGLFNPLVVAGGYAFIVAVALPLASFALVLLVLRCNADRREGLQ